MRLVALMNLGSHILLDAATAPYRRCEILLAQSMTAAIPDNSITLFDKLFYSADLLLTLNQQGRHQPLADACPQERGGRNVCARRQVAEAESVPAAEEKEPVTPGALVCTGSDV